MHGLTFQFYSTVFSLSLKSKKYELRGQKYEYHKIKSEVFYNALGLMQQDSRTIAGRERTICDLLYVYPGTAFDSLNDVDAALLCEISRICSNKRLEKDVNRIITEIEGK
ncbi:MAG TPA: hypothetical protein VF809_00610 [Candidatus Saccharimonadales bacterium]